MARNYHILVTFSYGELTIQEPRLRLGEDNSAIHSVTWGFEGIGSMVAAGWLPKLVFVAPSDAPRTPYTGPFATLGSTRSRVIASGNTGIPGRYPYRAILEAPPGEDPIESQRAVIENAIPETRRSVIQVRSVPDREVLEVRPRNVQVVDGQPLQWEVIEEPRTASEWYPRLLFSEGHPFLGPFASVTTSDKTILATGSGGQPGSYGYRFQMISVEDGSVLFQSSPDPTVDDEGDPPITGGEGSP